MGGKNLLIAGIDPGTTVGYAVIDLDGNVIAVDSSKNLDMNSLIAKLISFGRIVVIGTDKKKNPGFVDKIGIKLGAKVIAPEYDLKVVEKRELVRNFKTDNQHEIDALASAFYALQKIKPLLNKINIFVEHYKKEPIKEQLTDFVISKGLNIRDSLEMIEQSRRKEENPIIYTVQEREKEKLIDESEFIMLSKNYKKARQEIDILKRQNDNLRMELKKARNGYDAMLRRLSKAAVDRKMMEMLKFRDKRVKIFDSKLRLKEDDARTLQDEITTLIYFLSNIGSKVLLKRLENLGYEELKEKIALLNISKGDVLLVKDPDIASSRAVELLKNKVDIILYEKPVSSKVEQMLPFVFIDAKKLNIEENKYFALADKKELEEQKKSVGILNKIVENYRKERMISN